MKTETWTTQEYKNYVDGSTKKSKYLSKKIKIDGITFDSQKEGNYYSELKLLLKNNYILGFARQVKFILVEGNNENLPVTYRADFVVFYKDKTEIIDVKGYSKSKEWERTYKLFKLKFPFIDLKII